MLWPVSALVVFSIVVFWSIGVHSRLNNLRKIASQSFIQVDAQVQQRYLALHALIKKATATQIFDMEVLVGIDTAYRNIVQASQSLTTRFLDAKAMQTLTNTECAFTDALEKFLAQAATQASPSVIESVAQLHRERANIDNRMAFAHQQYNQAVAQYNAALVQFPGIVIARLFGFRQVNLWHGANPPVERRFAHRGV